MTQKTVDFAALARVSLRAELRTVRLAEVTASCDPQVVGGTLEAKLDNDCEVVGRHNGSLRVACNYRFTVQVAEAQAAQATIKYLLDYDLRGNEPLAEDDIAEFAFANGTLHSWPFVREFLYGLTAKMGFLPYTLPVFHFVPKPPQKKGPEDGVATTQSTAPSPKEST